MTPVRFTPRTLSQSARWIVSNVCPSSNRKPGTEARPALANTTSTPPCASTTSSKSPCTASSSLTSTTNGRASRPRGGAPRCSRRAAPRGCRPGDPGAAFREHLGHREAEPARRARDDRPRSPDVEEPLLDAGHGIEDGPARDLSLAQPVEHVVHLLEAVSLAPQRHVAAPRAAGGAPRGRSSCRRGSRRRCLADDEADRRVRRSAAVADDRVDALPREHSERGGVRRVGADEVDHDVDARAVRQLARGARDVRLLAEDLVRAELARQAAAALVGVDGDHLGRAEHADELQGDVPDPADADHGRSAPGLEARDELLHRVVGRDASVGVRRDRGRLDAVRQPDERPLVREHVVREAAVARQPRELVTIRRTRPDRAGRGRRARSSTRGRGAPRRPPPRP